MHRHAGAHARALFRAAAAHAPAAAPELLAPLLDLAACYALQPDEPTGLLGVSLLQDGVVALAPCLADPGLDPDPDPDPDPGPGASASGTDADLRGGAAARAAGAAASGVGLGGLDEGAADKGTSQGALEQPTWDAALRALARAAAADHLLPLLDPRASVRANGPAGGEGLSPTALPSPGAEARARCRMAVLMQRCVDSVHRRCGEHMPPRVQLRLLTVLQACAEFGPRLKCST